MKIGFLAEPYEETNASGMGYVAMEYVRHLLALASGDAFTIYASKEVRQEAVPGEYKVVRVPKSMMGRMRFFFTLKDDIDVFICNVPLTPVVLPRRVKAVLICQEIVPLKLPRRLSRGALLAFVRDFILMPWSLTRAAKIVVPSLTTKELLMQVYNVKEEKISLIYNGFQDLSRFASEAKPVEAHLKPYFFFAGKIKPRKNVHGIVSAFIQFKERTKSETKLVLAGDYGGEYYENLLKELNAHRMRDQVYFLGYVTGAPLYSLYKEALALVFPSFSEGFGMPIAEAFAAGVPVITSTITATAEVAGNAAILVDPHNPESLSRAMEKIWADKSLREELIKNGFERVKDFSWPRAAQEVKKIIESV